MATPGEWQRPGDSGYFRQLMQSLQARRAWEAAHPELAAAWDAALREDDERTTTRDRQARLQDARGQALRLMRGMGVPLDALEVLAGTPREEPSIRAARDFLREDNAEKRWLLLCGKKGTGKTVAAALVLGTVLARQLARDLPSGGESRRAPGGMFLLAAKLARSRAFGAEAEAWLDSLCETPCLVLDDLGAERSGEVGQSLLEEVCMQRDAQHRRTVITTNLTPAELATRLGGRLWDRIEPTATLAQSLGDSLRRKAP